MAEVIDAIGNEHFVNPGADLSGINFTGADLKYINFAGVNLTGANLSGAIFKYNNFAYINNDSSSQDNYRPAILENVTWSDWVRNVIDDGIVILLTINQIHSLYDSNPESRAEVDNYQTDTLSGLAEFSRIYAIDSSDNQYDNDSIPFQGGKRKSRKSRKVKKTNKRRKSNKRRKTKRRYRK